MQSKTFQHLVSYFQSRFTYRRGFPRTLGIEKEVLAVDSHGRMADLSQTVWPAVAASQKYKLLFDDHYKDSITGFEFGKNIVTTDAGLGTFEFILPPVAKVQDAEKELNKIYRIISPFLKKFNFKMLGMGFQPLSKGARANWNKKQRYEILDSHYGKRVYYSTLSASDQVHLDIALDEVIPSMNAFNKLNGFFLALFGNSPIMEGKIGPMEPREVMWDFLGKRRTGLPPHEFTSIEEYLTYLWNLKCIMVKKGNKMVDPKSTFAKCVEGKPRKELIAQYAFHEGTTWFSSRPRVYGTLEIRPCGLQPFADQMSVSAFCTGLMENLPALTEFLKQFSWKQCQEFRYVAARVGMDAKIKGRSVVSYLVELLTMSEDGLLKRKYGEETYLRALKDRVKRQKNPAQEVAAIFKKGGISALLKARGFIA